MRCVPWHSVAGLRGKTRRACPGFGPSGFAIVGIETRDGPSIFKKCWASSDESRSSHVRDCVAGGAWRAERQSEARFWREARPGFVVRVFMFLGCSGLVTRSFGAQLGLASFPDWLSFLRERRLSWCGLIAPARVIRYGA